VSNRRPPSAETIRAAEQRAREYLASVAGRDFSPRFHEVDAAFTRIGFPFALGPDIAFQQFIDQSPDKQELILTRLVEGAKENPQFHDAATFLYNEVALSRRLTQPFMSRLFRDLVNTVRPDEKKGPNESERNALVLNLMNILTAEFGIAAIFNSAKAAQNDNDRTPNNDACGIVLRAMNKQFPILNLTRDGVRVVWESHRKMAKEMAEAERLARAPLASSPEAEG